MTNKFKNKYRIPSARMRNWDYKWNAPYFITICTQNRICYFGDVVNGKIQLSEIGEIVKQEWLKTFKLRPDMNLQMGEWVIMPNHFHAVIVIGENNFNRRTDGNMKTKCRTDDNTVQSIPPKNQFGPQSKNLASVIRGFKIGVTKNARQIHADFAWQPRYHDRVIRDEKSFQTIEKYIMENPLHWVDDIFNK